MMNDPLSEPEKLDQLISVEDLTVDREFAGGEATKKLFVQGSQCYADKRYEEAIRVFEEAKEICPVDASDEQWSIHYNKALSYEKLNDLKSSVVELEKALEFFRTNPLVLAQLDRICTAIGEPSYVEKGLSYRVVFWNALGA